MGAPPTGYGRARWLTLSLLVVAPLAALVGLGLGFDPQAWEASQPLIHRQQRFVGAASCRPCHPDQHASWQRTFHRSMTQRPTPDAVLGRFDGQPVEYEGRSATPHRRGDRFFIDVPDGEAGTRTAEVALAVGSRRYQQYFEREPRGGGFVFVRLPILWHVDAERWLHMNTVFLSPDDPDWNRHRSRWNDNCIFCHNTGARPGEVNVLAADLDADRGFDSEVAQLGIGCESCHGPGAEHVARYRDPLTRYAAHLVGDDDLRIVNPERLDRERSVSVCGQCHGQRLALDMPHLVQWLTEGPSFRSGDKIRDHARPIERDTPPPSENWPDDLFRERFWADGTPRLTAYEYQGVVDSACYARGSMSCGSCHTMHGGDPRGMIEPEMRGNDACLPCHERIARDVKAHTFHDPRGSGSDCMECHMPRMVYGVLEIHRSHRVENPDPRRDGEAGRPHACTLCHLDRDLDWSADKMREWWGEKYERPARRGDGAPTGLADSLASMLAGDAVQRAVYAYAAGRPDSPVKAEDKQFLRAALAITLADAYPSIRWMARRSLLALEREWPLGSAARLIDWDHTRGGDRARMARSQLAQLAAIAPGSFNPPRAGLLIDDDMSVDMDAVLDLLDLQDDHVISIGE